MSVVDCEALAYFAGVNPDNSVGAGVVGGKPAENFNADGAFLQILRQAGQRAFDYELQEILAALAGFEFRARKDALEFCSNNIGSYPVIHAAFHDQPTDQHTRRSFGLLGRSLNVVSAECKRK